MAYPQARSCTVSLKEGMTDATYKHYRPNTAGIVEDTTAGIRRLMSGVWHGFNEVQEKCLPDGRPFNTPYFVSVTPEDEENV